MSAHIFCKDDGDDDIWPGLNYSFLASRDSPKKKGCCLWCPEGPAFTTNIKPGCGYVMLLLTCRLQICEWLSCLSQPASKATSLFQAVPYDLAMNRLWEAQPASIKRKNLTLNDVHQINVTSLLVSRIYPEWTFRNSFH